MAAGVGAVRWPRIRCAGVGGARGGLIDCRQHQHPQRVRSFARPPGETSGTARQRPLSQTASVAIHPPIHPPTRAALPPQAAPASLSRIIPRPLSQSLRQSLLCAPSLARVRRLPAPEQTQRITTHPRPLLVAPRSPPITAPIAALSLCATTRSLSPCLVLSLSFTAAHYICPSADAPSSPQTAMLTL